MIKNILNLGDAAVYCDFGKDVNQEINSTVIKYFYHINGIKILIKRFLKVVNLFTKELILIKT